MISLLLMKQITKLLLMLFFGFLLVKCGLAEPKDSKPLSLVALYLIMPCVIVKAFQVEPTKEVCQGLLLAFGIAILIHVLLLALSPLLKKAGMDPVERTSVFYSNAGNLLIPIVVGILGEEWVLYSSAFVSVQTFLLWTHARIVLSGERKLDWKKIFLNINLISIFLGLFLFVTQIRFPDLVNEVFDSVGGMIGPLNMIVAGMLLAGISGKRVLSYKRLPLVILSRMVICPLLILIFLKLLPLPELGANSETIVLICYLASITPTAAVITQMAQVFHQDAQYASVINAAGTLISVVTMPVMAALYQLL